MCGYVFDLGDWLVRAGAVISEYFMIEPLESSQSVFESMYRNLKQKYIESVICCQHFHNSN